MRGELDALARGTNPLAAISAAGCLCGHFTGAPAPIPTITPTRPFGCVRCISQCAPVCKMRGVSSLGLGRLPPFSVTRSIGKALCPFDHLTASGIGD